MKRTVSNGNRDEREEEGEKNGGREGRKEGRKGERVKRGGTGEGGGEVEKR